MGIPAHKVGHPEPWNPTYIGISDEVINLLTGFNIFMPFGMMVCHYSVNLGSNPSKGMSMP